MENVNSLTNSQSNYYIKDDKLIISDQSGKSVNIACKILEQHNQRDWVSEILHKFDFWRWQEIKLNDGTRLIVNIASAAKSSGLSKNGIKICIKTDSLLMIL